MYYKQITNGVIASLGTTSNNSLPDGFEEITEAEYNELLAEIMANAPQEEETEEVSEYDSGFEEGYMQALLDLMELEESGEE